MFHSSTIFALSSGSVPSGVAVIRISGSRTRDALTVLGGMVPPARQLVLRPIVDTDGSVLDRGLIVFFEAPHSFTGEDCAELHLHGGRAVVAAVLARLGGLQGLRQAEAGEFTKRAFINGKLDLTGAEALADLVLAETEIQRRLAQANADGRQSAHYADWRRRLVHGRAMIEAELDFSDEADVPGAVSESIWADMAKLRDEMQHHLQRFHAAEIVRDGFRVVILGAPNAGKSSLLNCLAGRDVAIVTDEPGTTRDVLEVALDLGGIKVILSDTAGIRAEPGSIEAIGIARAQSAARQADLVLMLQDMQAPVSVAAPPGVEVLKVGTKLDLASSAGFSASVDLAISSHTGAGIDTLLARLAAGAAEKTKPVSESAVPTRQRHIELIATAIVGLDEALNVERPLELRVEGLRVASDRIGRLSGEISPEEVLGEIFSAFCIGK